MAASIQAFRRNFADGFARLVNYLCSDTPFVTNTSTLTQAVVVVDSSNVPVPVPVPAFGTGQLLMTGAAIQFPANASINSLTVGSNATNNSAGIFVGGAGVTMTDDGTGNGFKINPAFEEDFALANSNQAWVIGTAGDIVYWHIS